MGRYTLTHLLQKTAKLSTFPSLGLKKSSSQQTMFKGHDHMNQELWPRIEEMLSTCFRSQTQSYWTEAFDGEDACVTPVVTLGETLCRGRNSHPCSTVGSLLALVLLQMTREKFPHRRSSTRAESHPPPRTVSQGQCRSMDSILQR